jgi:hypothetical protein
MKQKRKRVPGGGRKASGPFVQNAAQLTIRMPIGMRAELEAAAEKRGRSLTQELLWRVQDSFNLEHNKRRDPALRALNFVIAQMAERISGGMYLAHEELRQGWLKEWRTDPFKFRAFKFAVGKLLDELQPPGEIRPAPSEEVCKEAAECFGFTDEFTKWLAEINKTPEAKGAFEFEALWTQLTRSNRLTQREKEWGNRYPYLGQVMEREFYGFADARRDLKLPGLKEKKP